jgi:hypothetical protein
MGPLAGRIAPEDRWAAIAWVRVLQRAGHATRADVPAGVVIPEPEKEAQ